MYDSTLALPGLSPVLRKGVVARFDGGRLSSDAGVLVLREVEQRLGVAERLAGCIADPRAQAQVVHGLADMIRFRMLMIAAGYEDGNDASNLRSDPAFKLAQGALPSGPDLASQPTISRLENLPNPRSLLRMGRALIDLYCASFRRVPKSIVLDLDDTFDAVHGGQQLRLFNAHHHEYGFRPIVVFDGDGRFVTALLRPAKRPKGTEIRAFLRRLLRAIRTNWPNTQILIRADSHYCCPEVIDFCRANGLDFILGVGGSRYSPTTSRTFSTNCGSVDSLNVSVRCGCKQKARQIRCTDDADMPDAFAMPRVLQCVASEGLASSVLVTISSIRSSPILRGAPHLGSSPRPSRRCLANRSRQIRTVWRVTPTADAIWQLFSPSAARRMISARCASARAILRRRTQSALSWIMLGFPLAIIAPANR